MRSVESRNEIDRVAVSGNCTGPPHEHHSASAAAAPRAATCREWIRVHWLWARESVEHRGLPHHTQHHPQTGRGLHPSPKTGGACNPRETIDGAEQPRQARSRLPRLPEHTGAYTGEHTGSHREIREGESALLRFIKVGGMEDTQHHHSQQRSAIREL